MLSLPLHACTAGPSVDLSRVDGPRLLAAAATPAEVTPGESIELSALWVDRDGTMDDAALRWSVCTATRALADNGPVADACLDGEKGATQAIPTAMPPVAEVPEDACRWFGPDPPPAQPGEPQGRPVEPDRTGGYYQPIIVDADGEQAVLAVRLDCGVAGATQAQAALLRRRHRANVPPRVEALVVGEGEAAHALEDDEVLQVAVDETITLRVRWPACPQVPSCGDGVCTLDEDADGCAVDCRVDLGCAGAEWYARFDPVALRPLDAREAIGVAWYATAGELEVARTGRSPTDPARSSDNRWTAPSDAGRVSLWVVLRDERGAASWRELQVEVQG